jgi:regulator of sirC expression with transglutaminase-like and TPR domain
MQVVAGSQPAGERAGIEAELRAIGAQGDGEIDLAEAALSLACLDRPGVPKDRYRTHLTQLADAVAAAATPDCDADVAARVAVLNAVLLGEYGYVGDRETYDDLQNANLMRVIDRRRGLPISLGILYIAAGRRQGWAVQGVDFPGHFLLRLELETQSAVVDPFNGGRLCDAATLRELLKAVEGAGAELTPAHYVGMPDRAILLRLQNNVRIRCLREQKLERALGAVRAMLLLAPERPEPWYDAAGLLAQLGNLREATAHLETYIARESNAERRYAAATALQRLRAQLN